MPTRRIAQQISSAGSWKRRISGGTSPCRIMWAGSRDASHAKTSPEVKPPMCIAARTGKCSCTSGATLRNCARVSPKTARCFIAPARTTVGTVRSNHTAARVIRHANFADPYTNRPESWHVPYIRVKASYRGARSKESRGVVQSHEAHPATRPVATARHYRCPGRVPAGGNDTKSQKNGDVAQYRTTG